MSSESPPIFDPPTSPRFPVHPIECLRIIQSPTCVVCGSRTVYYCGGCTARPAFCSAEHFMKVRRPTEPYALFNSNYTAERLVLADTLSDLQTRPSRGRTTFRRWPTSCTSVHQPDYAAHTECSRPSSSRIDESYAWSIRIWPSL